jgi:hypothetical protein
VLHLRHWPNSKIELGSGRFGADQWWLMYDPDGTDPPDEDHLPSGPMVTLYVEDRGSGGPINPLSGSLGRAGLLVRNLHSTAFAFGNVAFGFDHVHLDCAKGPTVDAVIVDCAQYLPFDYYVGEVASRVVRVRASGPDGRTVALEQDQ